MQTRKKKVVPATHDAPAEEHAVVHRPVTQVVEVLAEDEIPDTDASDAPKADDDEVVTVEAAPPETEPSSEPVVHNAMDPAEDVPDLLADEGESQQDHSATLSADAEEKRKEMVDELFQPEKTGEPVSTQAAASAVMLDISIHKKRSMMPMVWWALIVIVVAVLTGGGILFATGGGKNLPGLVAAPTPTPTPAAPTPTPTPAAEVVKDAVKIQVLNGSGVTGVAKTMKTLLEEKGYVVEKTGNADNEEFAQTEIHVKADKEQYLAVLGEDLKDSYTIGASAADLSEIADDVQIIIGKE